VYRSAVASDGPAAGPTCESCGDGGRALRPVHRVYLERGADGALRVASTEPRVEWWCPSCVAQYPNEPVDAAPDGPGGVDEPGG
jgi:hypothetical protein